MTAITARLRQPEGVAVNSNGEILIADTQNARIRKVTPDGIINTISGNGVNGFSGESGFAVDHYLEYPYSVAVTDNGEIVICDSQKITKIDKNGIVAVLVGNVEARDDVVTDTPEIYYSLITIISGSCTVMEQ